MTTTATINELPTQALPVVTRHHLMSMEAAYGAVLGGVRSIPAGVTTPIGGPRFRPSGGHELPVSTSPTLPVTPVVRA